MPDVSLRRPKRFKNNLSRSVFVDVQSRGLSHFHIFNTERHGSYETKRTPEEAPN